MKTGSQPNIMNALYGIYICSLISAKQLMRTYQVSGNLQMHSEHRRKHRDPNWYVYITKY